MSEDTMTDDTTDDTAETVDDAAEDTTDAAADGTAQDDDETDGGNAEAARYRRRLREAERQRDELAARVAALQQQQAERMLPAGIKPDAVWAVTGLADVLDGDGLVDRDKLDAAVVAARERFGITKPSKGTHVPGVGNQPDRTPRIDGWRQAFTPSRKR